MSYNHKLVSAVKDNEIDLNQADWSLYPELATFAREVKRALRMGDLRVASPPGAATYCYIYRPQDKYIMGRLEYEFESTYGVYSRNIENKRYNNYNADHYTKKSAVMKNAVKHALAYLRPYKPVEVAHRRGSELDKFISSVPEQLRSVKTDLIRDLTANYNRLATDTFEAELRHLVQSGYRFMNPEIGEKLAKYFEVKQAHEEATHRKHDMVYLRVYVHNDQQLADIALLPHELVKRMEYNFAADYYNLAEQAEGVPIEQLSDNLIGRVSVLSMLQVEQGEPGVGFKASDDEFFIYPEPEVASE
jgi:hypothetical protein